MRYIAVLRGTSVVAVALAFGLVACHSTTGVTGAVRFTVDSPLCGTTTIHYEFLVDSVVVGDEILKSGQTSRDYTAEGSHLIGARILGSTSMLLEDRVTILAGTQSVEILKPYCS